MRGPYVGKSCQSAHPPTTTGTLRRIDMTDHHCDRSGCWQCEADLRAKLQAAEAEQDDSKLLLDAWQNAANELESERDRLKAEVARRDSMVNQDHLWPSKWVWSLEKLSDGSGHPCYGASVPKWVLDDATRTATEAALRWALNEDGYLPPDAMQEDWIRRGLAALLNETNNQGGSNA